MTDTIADIKFSIIIPSYNRSQYIMKTVQSVINQSYGNFEIIIVDDGSTDNTESLVNTLSDFRISYYKTINNERGAARNYGISKATGSYVTFLDSDDLLRENHLHVAYCFIKDHQSPTVFHTGYDIVNEDGSVTKKWAPLPSPVNDRLVEGNYLSCLGIFVKREVLNKFNFNEDRVLSGSEDYELWMRLAVRFDILTCPVSTAILVDHDDRSVVKINSVKLINRIETLKKSLHNDELFVKKFSGRLHVFYSYLDIYIALHLAMSNYRKEALKYWRNAFLNFPFIIFNIRFWIVVKKMIFR